MSAVYFYTQNLKPLSVVPFPMAIISTDRITDIPDAEITLTLNNYKKEMTVGGFFQIHGIQQVFRISSIDISFGEDADGTVTVKGEEFTAWLLTTRRQQRDFIPTPNMKVESVSYFYLVQALPGLSPNLASWNNEEKAYTPIASCIVSGGDTAMDYLEDELKTQQAISRFKSWFGYQNDLWPIVWDIDVKTESPVLKFMWTAPEIESIQLSYKEREYTEIIYSISNWYGESPAAQANTALSISGCVSEFSYSPAFDDINKDMDRLYSSIGVITEDAGSLDASSLTYNSCRKMPWDAFNVNTGRDEIEGGTATYKDEGNLIKVLNPKTETSMPVLKSENNVTISGIENVDYSALWENAPANTEFIYFKAWDQIPIYSIEGQKEANEDGAHVPCLTIGVLSQHTYQYAKSIYNWIVKNEMDFRTGAYRETWGDPDIGITNKDPYYIVVPRNIVFTEEGGSVIDEEASLQASRVWYSGRGWIYLISIYSGYYGNAGLVPKTIWPKVGGIDRSSWIPVSRLTQNEYNSDGNLVATYTWLDNPEYGYFPVLASALEMKQAQKLPARYPAVDAEISFAKDFNPEPGTDIQIAIPGGGVIEGMVSSVTRSEEQGTVKYDAEVEEWFLVGDPEEDT